MDTGGRRLGKGGVHDWEAHSSDYVRDLGAHCFLVQPKAPGVVQQPGEEPCDRGDDVVGEPRQEHLGVQGVDHPLVAHFDAKDFEVALSGDLRCVQDKERRDQPVEAVRRQDSDPLHQGERGPLALGARGAEGGWGDEGHELWAVGLEQWEGERQSADVEDEVDEEGEEDEDRELLCAKVPLEDPELVEEVEGDTHGEGVGVEEGGEYRPHGPLLGVLDDLDGAVPEELPAAYEHDDERQGQPAVPDGLAYGRAAEIQPPRCSSFPWHYD